MKARLHVPPTKSSLLRVSRQARFLEQGQTMLEKKRDLLTRLVYDRLGQYRELRAQTAAELAEAYRWLGIVHMRMGGQMLRQAAVGLQPVVAIRILARSSVGVEYPSVTVEPLPLQPVGLMWTDPSFDETRLRLQRLTLTLARLGEAENALWRLLAASRKTRMRVNALRHNIIPRYHATVRYIRAMLEEDERNTLFQVKKLAEMG
ncbi:V-type ATP synthase subunit D [Parasulfuritortus cantonensis]|uniref:V-type ATP synthase subunit D n=1 Tax=Parasulfuritortus cantonensis TaxID=2528202 RepID=A0A4V2NWM9_9PROT|nr:V-type ATP synthase subunit D [Parasulfuritortus cantonensis]TCJ18002.1 V-type ATP synthase subunit D [Parasulfuritortus cantonensis]